MGASPVTRGQFAVFVKAESYMTEAETGGQGGGGYNQATRKGVDHDPKYTWNNPGFDQTDYHPVVNVTWNDAVRFCRWLSKREQKTYELPTEAEWEYACRAGTLTRFWCGNKVESLQRNFNVLDMSAKSRFDAAFAKNWHFQSWNDGYPFTSPIESIQANPLGLYDMGGNVWQWCTDKYGSYHNGLSVDPQSEDGGENRILRGGSWNNDPNGCRSACRTGFAPTCPSFTVGFRIVLRPGGDPSSRSRR
jgi:formylglycine-generating enzyme